VRRLAAPLVLLAASACSTAPAEPTRPDPEGLASLIPAAPAPSPTVSPTPPPDDEPLPASPGSGGGVGTASCGAPVPPKIARVNVKVHSSQGGHVVLDATPLVGPDGGFCAAIGYTDGRSFCPVRPDGHPEREACEALRVGRADDTGRVGPTWSAGGRECRGPDTDAPCLNHPANQYLVFTYGAGTFRACASNGACGQITLP
jgi:hypothetical protein